MSDQGAELLLRGAGSNQLSLHEDAMKLADDGAKFASGGDKDKAGVAYALAAVAEYKVYQMIPASLPRTRIIIEESYKALLIKAWEYLGEVR